MNIGKYKIQLTLDIIKNDVNETAVVRAVNKVVPKNAMGISNHIQRIKEIRKHPEYWHNLEAGEVVSLADAKHFADAHWKH